MNALVSPFYTAVFASYYFDALKGAEISQLGEC